MEKEMTYKNCNHCEWMGEVVDSFPDKTRCPACLTPWDSKDKLVKPLPGSYRLMKGELD